jgi:hypothetical protein
MENDLVIARGFQGKPLKRVAMGRRKGLVYLANPALLAAIRAGESEPVGFPATDVFAFDDNEFAALEREWEARGSVAPAAWATLSRYAS